MGQTGVSEDTRFYLWACVIIGLLWCGSWYYADSHRPPPMQLVHSDPFYPTTFRTPAWLKRTERYMEYKYYCTNGHPLYKNSIKTSRGYMCKTCGSMSFVNVIGYKDSL